MSQIWVCRACDRVREVDDDGHCVECRRTEQRLVTDGGDREVDILQLSSGQATALGEQRTVVIHTDDRSIFLVPESVRISDALAEIDAEVSFEYVTDREVCE